MKGLMGPSERIKQYDSRTGRDSFNKSYIPVRENYVSESLDKYDTKTNSLSVTAFHKKMREIHKKLRSEMCWCGSGKKVGACHGKQLRPDKNPREFSKYFKNLDLPESPESNKGSEAVKNYVEEEDEISKNSNYIKRKDIEEDMFEIED
ncbi:MAG: SEC-C domain-containing protein [Candidatus Aenigmarchaeota archaeon]|nr:SEC-C domain-containing protein [Candidatus Aenigmarchaeota archaeon]